MRILEERKEVFICMDDCGEVFLRPNSDYYWLKYHHHNDGRIAHTFSDMDYVQETYDARIFNCWSQGRLFQFRQDLSDELAEHIRAEDLHGYRALFARAEAEHVDMDILLYYLADMDGLHYDGESFVVHGIFKVDRKGNAYAIGDMAWQRICIVLQGRNRTPHQLPDREGVMQNVNNLTMTIFAKVMFFLNPDMNDRVFKMQLGERCKLQLAKLTGGEKK